MSGERRPPFRRVVILSRDAAFAGLEDGAISPNGQVVRVSSGYEAAAEILAARPAALVIDLRALGTRHLRLFEVAREADVEMLVAGTIPAGMGTDVLSGARLLARSDLRAAIERIISGGVGPTEVERAARAPAKVRLAPAKTSSRESGGSGERRAPAPTRRQEGPFGVFQQDEALLTPDELSALLGDEP